VVPGGHARQAFGTELRAQGGGGGGRCVHVCVNLGRGGWAWVQRCAGRAGAHKQAGRGCGVCKEAGGHAGQAIVGASLFGGNMDILQGYKGGVSAASTPTCQGGEAACPNRHTCAHAHSDPPTSAIQRASGVTPSRVIPSVIMPISLGLKPDICSTDFSSRLLMSCMRRGFGLVLALSVGRGVRHAWCRQLAECVMLLVGLAGRAGGQAGEGG